MSEDGLSCSYYIKDLNCRCNLGHCLTTEVLPHAEEVFDDVYGLIYDLKDIVNVDYTEELINFLYDLQGAHDTAEHESKSGRDVSPLFMSYFEENMAKLAHEYSLTYSQPKR